MNIVLQRFSMICGVIIVLVAAACTPKPEQTIQTTAEVTIQGDVPGVEEVQTFELDNCDGKADATRVEERTQSIDVTISSEVAAKIGASIEVVSAEVQAAVGVAGRRGVEHGSSIQLVAPPGTRMVFQLVWVGNKQVGIVRNIHNSDIPVAFESFLPTDVRIQSQADIGCSGPSAPQPVFEPTTTSPMPMLFDIRQDISTYPGNFLSETRVPAGTSMEITVNDGEIHAVTAGTIRVAGVSLPGGQDRGSVVILLPPATYRIEELSPTWNWHGAFHLEPNDWKSLADVLTAQQMIPGTCSGTNGCSFVDVLVVGPDGLVSQYEAP